MLNSRQTAIPAVVRVKPGALDRMGIYARRHEFSSVVVLISEGLGVDLSERLDRALDSSGISIAHKEEVNSIDFNRTVEISQSLATETRAVIGFGGGKALDVAKYAAFLAGLPYLAVPTSLSNDGFCSPQSSLEVNGRRRSLPAAMPFGVIIDTAVCLGAPKILWHSGVGDLVSKFTAVTDWKLAFHAVGTPVDDFSALLSDASVYQFIARPSHDLEGMQLLGTALLLNGIAMSIGGSSRPASGSEHLISHALDGITGRPRLHGLQVGVAAYLVSLLQGQNSETIEALFQKTGFWDAIADDPFDYAEWMDAVAAAPSMKPDFYTVLSSRDCLPEIARLAKENPRLKRCFTGPGAQDCS
jgi:glycerol-1-phosphate dehydrogenase [NAD(P)+]